MTKAGEKALYHHYLPAFYQSRWTNEDGRLCRYSKPYGRLTFKRVSPRVSGAETLLYSDYLAPSESAHAMEYGFMSPLDSLASEALVALESGNPAIAKDPRLRSAWSRFLMSLMMRMPDHLETLKTGLAEEWARHMPELEVAYREKKGAGDPPTFAAFMDTRPPDELRSWMLSVLRTLMDHALIGEMINNMRWFVRNIDGPSEFLTSDRPLITSYEFAARDSYIILPISPNSAFVAVKTEETKRLIESHNGAEWIYNLNKYVVGAAVKFAFSREDTARDFIAENFGTKPRTTLFEYLIRYRQQKSTLT